MWKWLVGSVDVFAAGVVDVAEAGDCYLGLQKNILGFFPSFQPKRAAFCGRVGGGYPMENHNKREK